MVMVMDMDAEMAQHEKFATRKYVADCGFVFSGFIAFAIFLALSAFVMSMLSNDNIALLKKDNKSHAERAAMFERHIFVLEQHVAALEEWRGFVIEIAAEHQQKLGTYSFAGLPTMPPPNKKKGKAP